MIFDVIEMFIGGFVIVAVIFTVDSVFMKSNTKNNGK